MSESIAIVANGSIRNFDFFSESIQSHSYLIAVDGGLNYCNEMGLTPDLIIGDFDSVSDALLALYTSSEIRRFPADKDFTDLELALEIALKKNPQRITLYGALEKRIDHSIYNLYLLCRHPFILQIESEYETVFAINKSTSIDCFQGQTLSLLPFGGTVKGVTTKGLKWELNNASFDQNMMSISNVCLSDHVKISFEQGILICSLVKP
jgi:thiamine pyrophosphokinase